MSSASRKRPAGSEAEPVQPAKARSSLECSVCLELFDAEGRKPRVLVCGHSLCQACCQASQESKCPRCRREVPEGLSKQPVNFALLGTIEEDGPLFECHGCKRTTFARIGWFCTVSIVGENGRKDVNVGRCGKCIKNFDCGKPMLDEVENKMSVLPTATRELRIGYQESLDALDRYSTATDALRRLGLRSEKLGDVLLDHSRRHTHRHFRLSAGLMVHFRKAHKCQEALPDDSKTARLKFLLEKGDAWESEAKAVAEALDGGVKELGVLTAAAKAIVAAAEQLTKALADDIAN